MGTAEVYIKQVRRDIEDSIKSRLCKDAIYMLNTVSESVFSRSAHFILELLQNAEDAGGGLRVAASTARKEPFS